MVRYYFFQTPWKTYYTNESLSKLFETISPLGAHWRYLSYPQRYEGVIVLDNGMKIGELRRLLPEITVVGNCTRLIRKTFSGALPETFTSYPPHAMFVFN